MKTDEEMINSLFKRRDEYYKGLEKAKLISKNNGKSVLRIIGGIAVPIAAAAAVALTLVAVQKNIINNDIDLTESESFSAETKKNSGAAEGISAQQLLKLYESDRSELADDFKALDFMETPLCISYNGKIYKSDYYMTLPDVTYVDYTPTVNAETSTFTVAGTARVMESDLSETECTVFDVTGEPEYKAVVANGCIELYREMGDTMRTVQGIEFEIKALHRTAKKFQATRLPVLYEGEDIIYRAYDTSGEPVKDTFILYTPELTGAYSSYAAGSYAAGSYTEYAVWEVTGTIPEELLGEYPELCFISYEQLIDLCVKAQWDSLTLKQIMTLKAVNAGTENETRYQLYYTDESGREFVAEFYGKSDTTTIIKLKTNESIRIKRDIFNLDDFLSCVKTDFPEYNNDLVQSMTISREQFKSLVERMNNGRLTKENIISAGGIVWEENPKRLDFFFPGNKVDYTVTAVIGEDDRVMYFIAEPHNSGGGSIVIDTVSAFNEAFGDREEDRIYITYSDLLLLEEKAQDGTLTTGIIESMGARDTGSGLYIYELYYDLYSELYFKIEISAASDTEIMQAVITDIESGETLDMKEDNVANFIRQREEKAYQRYVNTRQYIDYSELKKIAEMAQNNTLTVQYLESIGAKPIYDGTAFCQLFYRGEHFFYEIYISVNESKEIKSVILINSLLKYSGDQGIDLMTEADKLDWYINRYLISYEQLKETAEKCANGTITPDDFIALNARFNNPNGDRLSDQDITVCEVYFEQYKAEATVINGKVIKVKLTYVYDTIDVGIDLMTDYKQFEVFLGNEPFPDVYVLEPITDKQLEELIDIIQNTDYEKRNDCDYNKIQDYILHNTDHLVSGAFYDEYRIIYEKDGKKYVITYTGGFYENSQMEISDGSGAVDIMNSPEKLTEFLDGTYSRADFN